MDANHKFYIKLFNCKTKDSKELHLNILFSRQKKTNLISWPKLLKISIVLQTITLNLSY